MATDIIAQGLAIKAGKAAQPATIRSAIRPYNMGTTLLQGLAPVMTTPPTILYGQYRGASAIAIAGGGTGYTVGDVLTVVGGSGLVTATTIYVNSVSGGVITTASIRVAGFYSGSGGVPSNAVSVTGGTGSGATFNLTYANGSASNKVFGGTTVGPSNAAFKATAHSWGPLSGGRGATAVPGSDAVVEFWTDALTPTLQFITSTHSFQVFVDGERIQSSGFAGSASGDYFYLSLDFGGVFKERRITIKGINLIFYGVSINTSESIWYPGEPARNLGYFFGDSYCNLTGTSSGAAFYDAVGRMLQIDVMGAGVGGTGWKSTSGNLPLTRINSVLSTINREPWAFFIPFGYNDGDGTGGATIQAQCYAVLEAITLKFPNAKIFLISPWTPLGNTVNLTYVATYMKAAFDAFVVAYPSAWARWIDISTVVTSSNAARYTGGDNVHPNGATGSQFLGDRIGQLCATQIWP